MRNQRPLPTALPVADMPALTLAVTELETAAAEDPRIQQKVLAASATESLSFPEVARAPEDFEAAARAALGKAIAKNTYSSYRGALGRLGGWLKEHGKRDLDDTALALYLAHLYSEGKSLAVATGVIAAVTFQAKLKAQPSPAGPQTSLMLAGFRRSSISRGRGQTTGINWAQADAAASLASDGSAKGARDAAMLSVMSDAMLKASEAAALTAADVVFYPDGSARLYLAEAEEGEEGASLFLGGPTVKRLRQWLAWTNPRPDQPLFPRLDKVQRPQGRISRQGVYLVIKARAKAVGIEGEVSSHSLRVGAAESLAAAGASVEELQASGRWKSASMPSRYARAGRPGGSAVARLRHGQ